MDGERGWEVTRKPSGCIDNTKPPWWVDMPTPTMYERIFGNLKWDSPQRRYTKNWGKIKWQRKSTK